MRAAPAAAATAAPGHARTPLHRYALRMGSVVRTATTAPTTESLYEQVKRVLRAAHPEWETFILACSECAKPYATHAKRDGDFVGGDVPMEEVQDHFDEEHPEVGKVSLTLVWIGPGAPPASNRAARRARDRG